MVPYDQASPLDLGRRPLLSYTRPICYADLETAVNWYPYWSGWSNATTSPNPSLPGKWVRLKSTDSPAPTYIRNKMQLSCRQAPVQRSSLAALELSYYLGQLEGKPVPIVASASTSTVAAQYSGTIYNIEDLKSLASDWNTMVANENNSSLPTEINVEKHGSEVDFRAWPYMNVLESVYAFLRAQGVVWSFPDPHGDYVPNTGVSLGMLPLTQPVQTIYANWDATVLDPWAYGTTTIRQDYLYAWRNGYTNSWNNPFIFGGSEVPSMPSTGISLSSDYTEGFAGYPHTFINVIPIRILNANPTWCGYVISSNSRVCSQGGQPAFDMSNSNAISWVAGKMVAVNASTPFNQNSTNHNYLSKVYQLLPMDATLFDQGTSSVALNSPPQTETVPYTHSYSTSQSGAYYNFMDQVAQQAGAASSSIQVGALAYADVWSCRRQISAHSRAISHRGRTVWLSEPAHELFVQCGGQKHLQRIRFEGEPADHL